MTPLGSKSNKAILLCLIRIILIVGIVVVTDQDLLSLINLVFGLLLIYNIYELGRLILEPKTLISLKDDVVTIHKRKGKIDLNLSTIREVKYHTAQLFIARFGFKRLGFEL